MNTKHGNYTTLRRRMAVQLGLMVACSLLIGVGAVVGINGLHQDMGVTVQGYRELRQIYEVGFQVAGARDALSSDHPNPAKALLAMETAQLHLDPAFYANSGESPAQWLNETKRDECRTLIQAAITQLKQPDAMLVTQTSAMSDVLGKLAMLSAEVRTTVVARQQSADRKHHLTLIVIIGFSAAVIVVTILAGTRQYRGVVGPLDRVARGVQRFAAGKLSDRISIEGDREFAALAQDFNHMADEIESLYRDLQHKVEIKSKELVRSERLASVGFLAAGVAHEINNPLSIITGYGERSLKLLDRGLDRDTNAKIRRTIGIICEEAFRCKGITDRLLSLARPGDEDRRPVSLPAIAQDIIKNIGGLPRYANRQIALDFDSEQDFNVLANDCEMKQIIINLLINSLEAVKPVSGRVNVAMERKHDEIEISIADNGSGMTPATLDRVFEPFFTDKPCERHGMGLGLSITHAIVASHGGRICAESDGPGRGSRFVVCFPAAMKGAEHAGG